MSSQLLSNTKDVVDHLQMCYSMRKNVEVNLIRQNLNIHIAGWLHDTVKGTWDALITKNVTDYSGAARVSFAAEDVETIISSENLSIIYLK